MHAALKSNGVSAHCALREVALWLGEDRADQVSLGRMSSFVSARSYAAHEHVFLEGEKRSHVYLVLSGVVGIYKLLGDGRRQISTFAYPGDIIGLDCTEHHVDSGEVLAPTRLSCIPVKAIDKLILSEPGFGRTLLHIAAADLAETRDRMLSLGRQSATERLAGFLLRVSLRQTSSGPPMGVVNIPMKRGEIADYLGLTIETVSRNFTRLKLAGVIRTCPHNDVEIVNRSRLEAIALGKEPAKPTADSLQQVA